MMAIKTYLVPVRYRNGIETDGFNTVPSSERIPDNMELVQRVFGEAEIDKGRSENDVTLHKKHDSTLPLAVLAAVELEVQDLMGCHDGQRGQQGAGE
jgi:hypothetical protein